MSATQILDSLLALSALFSADQERELDRRGLTPLRTHLLWVVFHGGPRTQAELAVALAVTPRHVTTLVDGLEAMDMAEREPHPHDRRAVLVTLTERGRAAMQAMDAEHSELGAQLIDGLDPATAAATLTGLTHILGRMTSLVDEHAARLATEAGAR